MKSIEFFIDKANSFITSLNTLELVDFYSNETTDDIYNEPIKDNKSLYLLQSKELEDVKFQIALMFSEFDNGFLFSQKLDSFKNENMYSNVPIKKHLLDVNELFLAYLNEYRVE